MESNDVLTLLILLIIVIFVIFLALRMQNSGTCASKNSKPSSGFYDDSSDESEEMYPRSHGYWKNHTDDSNWYKSGCLENDFEDSTPQDKWQFIDPLNDSTYDISLGELSIVVGGGSHDPYDTFVAPRYVTDVSNYPSFDVQNFTVETKILSTMSLQYQIQGIAIEQDQNNYIRFEAFQDNSKTHIYVQPTVGGAHQPAKVNITPFGNRSSPTPVWLRVNRSGNDWQLSYSLDGTNFTQTAQFSHPLNLTNVGVYAGSHTIPFDPSHTADFEYFEEVGCSPFGPNSIFFLSGKTWLGALKTPPRRGSAYYILAKQYIAAVLNTNAGVDLGVDDEMQEAKELFETYTPYNIPDRHRAIQLARILEQANTQ